MLLGILFSSIVLLLLAGFLWLVLLRHNSRKKQYLKEKQQMEDMFERQLLQSKIDVQEQTLTVLGQELHDNIGQLLSSAKMLLGATERKLAEVPNTLVTASETISKAITDIRSLSKTLNKEWLDQFNFIENLKTEVERIQNADIVSIDLTTNTTLLPISREAQLLLFRTVQEALLNSLKHAKAQQIMIKIECSSSILITVSDDGIGTIQDNAIHKGVGRINMKNRISLIGGTVDWESVSGKGTRVKIVLPIQNKFV
jgi:signal transduction histidine kinase